MLWRKKKYLKKESTCSSCGQIHKETTLGLHANVHVREGGIRPEILLHHAEHQLITDWKNGITFEEAGKRIEKAMNNAG
jgi:hypothetical protein